MTDKLKPCPFCGGKARLICVIKKFGRPVGWNVECFSFMHKCCAARIYRRRRKEAIEAWNRRVDNDKR